MLLQHSNYIDWLWCMNNAHNLYSIHILSLYSIYIFIPSTCTYSILQPVCTQSTYSDCTQSTYSVCTQSTYSVCILSTSLFHPHVHTLYCNQSVLNPHTQSVLNPHTQFIYTTSQSTYYVHLHTQSVRIYTTSLKRSSFKDIFFLLPIAWPAGPSCDCFPQRLCL